MGSLPVKPSGGEPKVKAGGTMWTIRDWRGTVYPEKDPQRTWPGHYGRQFGTLEFNATHYRIHPADRMAEWAAAMPEGFTFCPKFPQIITHFRRFNDCDGPTDDFIDGLLALGDKLGPAFIQLPPHFAPKHAAAMATYLEKNGRGNFGWRWSFGTPNGLKGRTSRGDVGAA